MNGRAIALTRLVVGAVWLAGAAFNLLVTTRMSGPFEWLEDSPVPVYRWFFRDIAGDRPVLWIVLLAIGEATLGLLTLTHGRTARIGLAGGALFSAFLFSIGTVYTLVMGPYALLLAWLARKHYSVSAVTSLRHRSDGQGEGAKRLPMTPSPE